ncbi:S41 family peptidase [Actinophytocola sediminis]
MRGYLRFPTIHAERVVFVAEDDLWSVPAGGGTATRLTAGLSEPASPRLSPDGTLVAFVAAEDGPPEVYVLPVAGGAARRLTYDGTRCAVTGWHPDTGEIVFASAAGLPTGFGTRLFAVEPDGGLPRLLPYGHASALAFGHSGLLAIGRNTADPARWKRYRGGTAGELWIAGPAGEFTRLPVDGNLAAPCWLGDRLYFLSDRTGVSTVHSWTTDGELTEHDAPLDFYARNLSGDGARLVHHAGGELYLVEPGAPTRRIDVALPSSRTQRGRRFSPAADHLHSAVPAPDGSALAVVARGKAFTMPTWSGPARQHGLADGVRYRQLCWLAGGTHLVAVAGDDRPAERLVLLPMAGGEPTEVSDVDFGLITEVAAAPAGQLVAVATQRQELHLVDPAAPTRLLDHAQHGRIEDLAWSPDGRWLAYAYPNSARTTGIRLVEVATGRIVPVTRPVLHDVRPSFDPDGRYLYFVGQRDFTPDHDQVCLGLGFPLGRRPYLVTLSAATPSPFAPAPKPLAAEFEDPPERAAVEVVVDPDGIDRRVIALPVPEARYQRVLGLRGKVLLLSEPVTAHSGPTGRVELLDLTTGEAEEHLTGVDDLVLSADGGTLVCQADKRLRVLRAQHAPEDTTSDDPGRDTGWVDLDRLKVAVDPGAEWRQMFREAWRLQRENFWDRDMSGVDWDALYQRYLPLVDLIASRGELSDLIWELHGELGTSHAYESGGEYRQRPEYAQGFLGVDWQVSAGRWRIARILRGDPWDEQATSPCNRPGTDIAPGDEVIAVNGQPVGTIGPARLLVGQAGQEVELTVARDGTPPRRVCVRALADESPARYRDWVEANRATADALSGGRVGYLHVPDMTLRGYGEFTRAFLTEHDREALVVDVRFNSGGFASWLMLEKLARRRQGHETGRWSGRAPYPPESPRGPMVALTNEHAGSDGDIFSHVFTTLGLGPLVGKRTWGGVVATWPRHDLVDGTTTTQPEFAYEFAGRWLENHGVEPDVVVDPAPHDHVDGVDHQLSAAIRLAMAQLPASSPATAESTLLAANTFGR